MGSFVWSFQQVCGVARGLLLQTILALVFLFPCAAFGNGMASHIKVSHHAIELLPDGPLKKLLSSNEMKQALYNGSYFPDTGYAAKDPYGELAHWEPFIEGYLQDLRSKHKDFTQGEGAKLFAFILGVASHSIADQAFDSIFMVKSEEKDPGSRNELDTGLEFIIATDNTFVDLPKEFIPKDMIRRVMLEKLKHKVSEDVMKNGISRARIAVSSIPLLAPTQHEAYRKKMPWAAKNILNPDEPASLPYLSTIAVKYWQNLWDRVHGKAELSQIVINSHPSAGGRIRSLEHKSVESRLFLFFGHNMDLSTLNDKNIFVKTAKGEAVPIKLGHWGSKGFNTLKILPRVDWKPNEDYVLTLTTGLKTRQGKPLPKEVTLRFHTHPPKKEEPKTPVKPKPGGPFTNDKGCGCQAQPEGLLPFSLGCLFFLVLFIRLFRGS